MKNKFSIALSLAVIMSMLLTSIGLADNVVNDVTVNVTDTFTAPGSTTVGYKINFANAANNQDPQAGCNASDGSPLTLTVTVPSGVSVTSSDATWNATNKSLTFSACSVFKYVVLSSSLPADYLITVNTSDSGTGAYNNNANFTLHVLPPPNTPPSVSVTGVSNNATYNKGAVPAAICDVTDAEDNPVDFPATLSAITGTYASDGIGSQTASCSYTDAGNLTATASATYSIVDPSAPVITYTLNPTSPDGSNSWYKGNVALTWNVSEPESPNSLQKTGCVDQNITADQFATDYSCSATSAGGSAEPVTVNIKRDGTLPTIAGSRTPDANGFGWNNGDVKVAFDCKDATSGLASCTPEVTVSAEGASQSVTGTAVDNAGNSAQATVSNINIDKSAPTATASASPAANANGWNNTDVTVSFSGSDGLSGIDTCSDAVTLSGEGAGQSASGTCSDKAGNVSVPATATVSIDKTAPTVALVAGPADGSSHYFGFVPAAPTCSASDGLSGLDGACSVSGYSNLVGTHTVTASAKDMAGNSASVSATYEVKAWIVTGFYAPVDKGIHNLVKGGATVPLKFEVFAGPTELTSTGIITTYVAPIACGVGPTDDIEQYVTGATSLRYDTTGGQFIWNWQTPKGAGVCYRVTVKTADGSTISADFKTK